MSKEIEPGRESPKKADSIVQKGPQREIEALNFLEKMIFVLERWVENLEKVSARFVETIPKMLEDFADWMTDAAKRVWEYLLRIGRPLRRGAKPALILCLFYSPVLLLFTRSFGWQVFGVLWCIVITLAVVFYRQKPPEVPPNNQLTP